MNADRRRAEPVLRDDWLELSRPLLEHCHFPPAGSVTCAVSGGADSLALLVLAVASGRAVTAIHVDHGLRVDSNCEAETVLEVALALGATFEARHVRIEPGANLEARARDARYGALPDDVLIGHTADDQAETILLHLLRGAGLDGLSALAADHRRPLLALRRHQTHRLCEALGLTPIRDPMNDDVRFTRVRVRHELIPVLDRIGRRDVTPILARQAAVLSDDAHLLDELAAAIDPTDARALAAAPRPLARRAVRGWLMRSGVGDGHPPSLAVIDRVITVAHGTAPRADLIEGWVVARTSQQLRLSPPS